MTAISDPLFSEEGGKAKTANYSEFMRKKVELEPKGIRINRCPFGCTVDQLDDHGYCDHLVGFTHEALGAKPGGKMEVCLPPDPGDRRARRRVCGDTIERIKAGDVLDRITNNYRVYREGGISELMEERATRPDPKTLALQPA